MRKIRQVLRLHYESNQSRRAISRSIGLSRDAVADTLTRAAAAKLTWPLPPTIDDIELEHRLFPPVAPTAIARKAEPNWASVHEELKREGATLQGLHEEYLAVHPEGMAYSLFCQRHRVSANPLKRYMRQAYMAGERLFVDYAGPTMRIDDQQTGQSRYTTNRGR
jgi:transposase